MGAETEAGTPDPGQQARNPGEVSGDTGSQVMAVGSIGSGGFGDFELVRGASWITQEGLVYPIHGFHDRWIQEHPGLARGAGTTVELLLATGWAAVSLYETGALEIILPSISSYSGLRQVASILERNPGAWSEARIFCLDAAGCITVEADAILAAEDACTELRRLMAAGGIPHST